MKNWLGWLETRLDPAALDYLNIVFVVLYIQIVSSSDNNSVNQSL